MDFYITEWADDTATLMTGSGDVLCVVSSIGEAQSSYPEDYSLEELLAAYRREHETSTIHVDGITPDANS